MCMDVDAKFVLFVSFVFHQIFAWYMLNTNFPNIPNVYEWCFRKIRAIRVIRVQP